MVAQRPGCAAALEVYTRAAHPVDWAMTQENLGLVFEEDCLLYTSDAADEL